MSGMRHRFHCGSMSCRSGLRKCWNFILCNRPRLLSSSTTTRSEDQKSYHVLCLGLSGSGKSTVLAQLVDDPIHQDNPKPTDGFNIKTLPFNGVRLSIKELGGSDRLQSYWSQYYDNKQDGLLFVVDLSSDDQSVQRSAMTLQKILLNPCFKNRPCLIVGTHADRPAARTKQQITEQLIQSISIRDNPWKLICCSSFDRAAIMEAFTMLTSLLIINVKRH